MILRTTTLGLACLALASTVGAQVPADVLAADAPAGDSAAYAAIHTAASDTAATRFVWTADWEDARAQARIGDRDILMIFAGSDWCRPCKEFRASILEDPTFQEGVAAQAVLLYLDFPARKKNQLPEAQAAHNAAFAERYNPEGIFPKVILFSPTEQRLGDLDFKGQDSETFLAEIGTARQQRARG